MPSLDDKYIIIYAFSLNDEKLSIMHKHIWLNWMAHFWKYVMTKYMSHTIQVVLQISPGFRWNSEQSNRLLPHSLIPKPHNLMAWCDGTICDSLQFVTAARFVTTQCFNLWPGTICDQKCFNLWPALYIDFRVQVVQGKTCFCVYTYKVYNMIWYDNIYIWIML